MTDQTTPHDPDLSPAELADLEALIDERATPPQPDPPEET